MRRLVLIFAVVLNSSYGNEAIPPDPEEARFLRRILAFWQDGDTAIVQSEIAQFFEQYPHSTYRDSLYILRGDLNWRQQNYEESLNNYERVQDRALSDKIFNNRLDCLLRLKRYEALIQLATSKLPPYSTTLKPDELLRIYYYAEALFHTQALSQAAAWYDRLLGTSQERNALLALSEIRAAIGGYQDAAHSLLALSYSLPSQQEELLARSRSLHEQHRALVLAEINSACQLNQAEEAEELVNRFEREFPHDPALSSVSLHLFNTYLQLSENNEFYLDKAAERLYRAGSIVKAENRFWLANYYYEKVRPLDEEEETYRLNTAQAIDRAKRAREILQSLLGSSPHPTLEREWIQLSLLEGWLNAPYQQIERLEALLQRQSESSEKEWKLRSRALYALGRAYELQGEAKMALDRYQQLTGAKSIDSRYSDKAKLYGARLAYSILPVEKRTLADPTMMAILKSLKELQMRRLLQQEPLHLEAAIDYAAIRSALEPNEKQNDQQRLLLLRIKEEFTSQEGLWAKDYQASRATYPEKDRLYQAYLLLIDAHRLRIEAKMALTRGHTLDAQIKAEAAATLYKSLTEGKFAVSKYLVDQALSGLESNDL